MDDDEYLNDLMSKAKRYDYHEICTWLPYKPETIEDIAHDIMHNGYREDRPIMLFEDKILDGRHRYEAALKAGVEPSFMRFVGTEQEAIDYVTSENVNRRHLNNQEKEFFYVQRAEALGVRRREDSLKQNTTDPSNEGTVPSAQDHADSLGVGRATIERWEKDRKDIKSDPELAKKANTFEGYKEAKKELKKRKATSEEAERIAKLKSLGERSSAESDNVERKLDKYREQGIDVEAVKSQGQKDLEREQYRKENRSREELSSEIAKILVDSKDYKAVAALANAAYPRNGELEKAHKIFKTE